jgi:glutamate--cysteine ligase catalytic subunit
MTSQSLPRLEEVDDMLKQSEKIQVSLQRMREVVYNHQQAVSLVEPPRESHYRPINGGYDQDGQGAFHEDPKANANFAGLDPNKRPKRGVRSSSSEIWNRIRSHTSKQRAAPPGRCHSCNRAETPEWRRGPDGARTLCNACGLRMFPHLYLGLHLLTVYRLRKANTQDGWQASYG